jgi:MFS family permease
MTSAFQSAAISEWNAAGQSSTLSVARAAIAAASQPVWAKIMDNLGRTFVVFSSTIFYILGYIVMASAQNFGALTGGLILQVFGFGAQNSENRVFSFSTNSKSPCMFSLPTRPRFAGVCSSP